MEQGGNNAGTDQSVDGKPEEKLIWNFERELRSKPLDMGDPDKSYNIMTDNFHYELRELIK